MTGPQTYHEAMAGLVTRSTGTASWPTGTSWPGSIATLAGPRRTDQDQPRASPEEYQPLTVAEHLEMLALGELIALVLPAPVAGGPCRPGRGHVGADRGRQEHTAEAARAAYREWAEGQHKYAGMGDAAYSAALERAGEHGRRGAR